MLSLLCKLLAQTDILLSMMWRFYLQGFIRPVARVGSGDPVRVLRLYTTNTLDEVCSIYCWDICTTCRYRSTCYSTGASGPTALSVCSRLCLVANCWLSSDWLTVCSRTVLYGAFYSYLCRRYWNGILGPSNLWYQKSKPVVKHCFIPELTIVIL